MKSPTISVAVSREHYRVFAAAVRLIRKEYGAEAPTAVALIEFQLAHRTAVGVAKEYLDCIGDFTGRRRVRSKATHRTARLTRTHGRLNRLRAVLAPKDPSRN